MDFYVTEVQPSGSWQAAHMAFEVAKLWTCLFGSIL